MGNYLCFRDLPRLPSHRFRYDNSILAMRIATPVFLDLASGSITVRKPWQVIGWSDKIDERLMVGRKGQIGLMLWHPDEGEAWEHYPLFDDDDRDGAVFVSR